MILGGNIMKKKNTSNKTYAIFGLGRYGKAVAETLYKNGADVLAIDVEPEKVEEAMKDIPICKCADVTNPDVLEQIGIHSIETVIIAMADNFQASVLATMLCKERGVPNVIVKCKDEMHRKILKRVGADRVVFPENDSGKRMAKNLLSSGFVDMMVLSDNISMVQIDVRDEWVGKSLIELNLRKKYSINIVAIRKGDEVSININPQMPLDSDMELIILASAESIQKLNK